MSVCEHHPIHKHVEPDSISQTTDEQHALVIQDELLWGQSYRHYKKKETEVPIPPKKSPINIPFKLCRELQRQELKKKQASKKSEKLKSASKTTKQPSLLEKSVMSQNQYMDYLSTPKKLVEQSSSPRKRKRPCELEPCPPRFVQLAVPSKRRVYENWKAYHQMLPTEVIVRYEQMLHTDKNLEPREARYYYKRLDKKKRKELKKIKMLRKKKQAEKEKGDKAWLKEQINLTTDAILGFIKEEPLFTLNFKQVMLSDAILDRLEKTGSMKKPSRKTKNHYKKIVVDVSDKLAVWMDTLTRFVDIQAVDSDEDIPPLTISSMEEEGEEEEEEEEEEGEEEGESEGESEPQVLFPEAIEEDFWGEGEDGAWGADLGVGVEKVEPTIGGVFKDAKGDEEDELDVDLLAKLIEILENSPEEVLQSLVNETTMRGVTYADVLDRLKALYSGELSKEKKKKPLAEVLEDWAKKNDPDKVDDKLMKEIHNAAEWLGEWWTDIEKPFEKQGATPLEAEVPGGEIDNEEATEITGIEKDAYVPGAETTEEEGEEEGEEGGWTMEVGGAEAVEEEEIKIGEEGEEMGGEAEEEGEIKAIGEEGEGEGEGEGEREGEAEAEAEAEGEAEVEAEEEGVGTAEIEGEEEAVEGEEEAELAEGGDEETQLQVGDLLPYPEEEKEEELGLEAEAEIVGPPKEEIEGREEEAEAEEAEMEEGVPPPPPPKEISVIFEVGMEVTAEDVGKIIKGHKPSVTFEHSPNMVCCLSLKTWAVWLLEITHNAHNWTKWVHGVIQQVREFAATIRGDVVGPDGKRKALKKQDWRDFAKEVDEMIVAWRQYGAHVRELSSDIVDNFHGKEVKCCPKCLQDHLIKNVVVAHETLQALTDAMNCASYWQRTLDDIVSKTGALAEMGELAKEEESEGSSEGEEGIDALIEELPVKGEEEDDGDSVYDIEEMTFVTEAEESGRRSSKSSPPGPSRKF